MRQSELWGRDVDRRSVFAAPAGLTVVSGDSGIGKSRLLASLDHGWISDTIVSEVGHVQALDGSIQRLLAQGLGDCIRQFRDVHPSDTELWTRLSEIATNAVDAGARRAGIIFVDAAFGMLEAKLGADATQVIRATLTEAFKTASAGFEAQLAQITTPDVVAELMHLATEIQKWTDSQLVVRLDSGERLTDRDAAFLAEIATSSPGSRVHVVLGVSEGGAEGRKVVRRLRERDATLVRLGPLDPPSIDDWLQAEGVSPTHWTTVARLTSGYPLFIQEAVALLQAGASLEDMESGEKFEALLEAAWEGLPADLQSVATQLVLFSDAPPDDFIIQYLECDPLEYGAWRRQLVDTRIFVPSRYGSEWFHDRRRAHIWRHILSATERASLASKGLARIEDWLSRQEEIEDWVTSTLPALIRESNVENLHPYLRSLLKLGNDEVALLWAMIEIIDPKATLGLSAETSELVRWASIRYSQLRRPLEALERLRTLEMTGSSANEHLSLTAMVVPNAICLGAVIGEIEQRFAAKPLQHIATRAFDAFLRVPLMRFSAAAICAGEFDLRAHRDALEDIGRKDVPIRFVGDIPALAINFSLERLPMSATVSFDSADERDQALQVLRSIDNGPRFEVRSVFEMPPKRVRWQRLVDVLTQLESREKVSILGNHHLLELVDARARAREIVRELTPLLEAEALGMSSRFRYLLEIADPPNNWIEYEISGAEAARADSLRTDDLGTGLSRDPLRDQRLQTDGAMTTGEHIARWTERYSRDKEMKPPLRALASEVSDAGKKFNKGLRRIRVQVSDLEELIRREIEIRDRLIEHLSIYGDHIVEYTKTDSRLVVLSPRDDSFFGSTWSAEVYVVGDGRAEVSVQIENLPRAELGLDRAERAMVRGITSPELVTSVTNGVARAVLAPLLGFSAEDIELDLPAPSHKVVPD